MHQLEKLVHSPDGSIDIPGIFSTAIPFLLAWYATSSFTGVYRVSPILDNRMEMVFESLKTTTRGWVVAIPLGCAIRGLIKGYVPPLPFVIVTMISTLIILGSLRGLYTYLEYPTDEDEKLT